MTLDREARHKVVYPLVVALLVSLLTTSAATFSRDHTNQAVLEERVKAVQKDVAEVKKDVKELNRYLRNEKQP